MSVENKRLLRALENIRQQFARAAKRQEAHNKRQRRKGRFRFFSRVNNEPEGLTAYQREQDQKSKLDADMVLWTRAVARYTRALVFVGVIGAVIAAGTLWAIKDQLNATFNDERPWIKVEGMIDKTFPIPIDLSSPIKPITFIAKLTNTGESPAFNVRIWASTFIPYEGGDMFVEQRKGCKNLSESPLGNWNNGYTIFPSDFVVDGEADEVTGGPWPAISEEQLKRVPVDKQVAIYILGCADYVSTFDKTHYQTGFIYRLARQPKGVDHPDIFFPRAGQFSASDLKLLRFHSETGTY